MRERVVYRVPPVVAEPQEPSAANAVERALEAGQRLVVERAGLIRLEAEEAIARAFRDAITIGIGGLLATLGWCVLVALAVFVLRNEVSLETSLAVVGGVHLLAGLAVGGMVVWRTRQRRNDQ